MPPLATPALRRAPDGDVAHMASLQRSDGAFRAPLELHESGEPYADPVHDTMWAVPVAYLSRFSPSHPGLRP